MDNTVNPNVTADEGAVSVPSPAGASKTVRFQCGLLRETETFSEEDLEDVSLYAILEFVVEMLNSKVLCIYSFIPTPGFVYGMGNTAVSVHLSNVVITSCV